MPKKLDLKGLRFERLTVLNEAGKSGTDYFWLCQCDCGNQTTVKATLLKQGKTRSCGCLQKEKARSRFLTHGESRKASNCVEHRIWAGLINRCCNPRNRHFENYGGRGIKVCDSWRNSYEAFLYDMGRCPEGHSIDRIDNDGDYSPENCRWASRSTQNRNKRTNRLITYGGKTMVLSDWAKELSIHRYTLYTRLAELGWSIEKAFTTPVDKRFGGHRKHEAA